MRSAAGGTVLTIRGRDGPGRGCPFRPSLRSASVAMLMQASKAAIRDAGRSGPCSRFNKGSGTLLEAAQRQAGWPPPERRRCGLRSLWRHDTPSGLRSAHAQGASSARCPDCRASGLFWPPFQLWRHQMGVHRAWEAYVERSAQHSAQVAFAAAAAAAAHLCHLWPLSAHRCCASWRLRWQRASSMKRTSSARRCTTACGHGGRPRTATRSARCAAARCLWTVLRGCP